ncbi:hypothetical protein GNX71_20355 [Variovorax sp. RKNM96]|uniref:hypothetical protein n=1 Tax=Variovorax sp. RKNM96 TaxID=2681552 RepID=UPI00197EED9E|nr:hypothetical protein [Variovorax sp. RKNM96]QSI31804.1 hypothetical protein GNX71_20355 [Variovorax sp. RKNM96]
MSGGIGGWDLVTAGLGCHLLFALLRALVQGEVLCIGETCKMQVYVLTTWAGECWAHVFFLTWIVLALGYAMYVTLRIWFRA